MITLQDVEESIAELERAEPTYQNCQKLSSLYIIRQNMSEDYSYSAPKSTLSGDKSAILNELDNELGELKMRIQQLYKDADFKEERNKIMKFINDIKVGNF